MAIHAAVVSTPEAQQMRFSRYDNPSKWDLAAAAEVRQAVNETEGKTFTEFAVFNLQAGRDPVLQPFIMSELARQGRWNQEPFLKLLESQDLELLVMQENVLGLEGSDVYTKEMITALKLNYKLDRTIPTGTRRTYYLLRPKTEKDRREENDRLVWDWSRPQSDRLLN